MHDTPLASEAPHPFVIAVDCENCVPVVSVIPVIVIVEAVLLSRKIVLVLVLFKNTLPKFRLVTLSETVPTFTPVPFRLTVSGPFGSLVTKTTAADSAPTILGVNVIVTVHVALTAREAPHALVRPKSGALAPLIVIEVIFSIAVPVFFSVNTWPVEVVPTAILRKVKPDGVTVAAGCVAAVTVAETGDVGALVPALFVAETSKLYTPINPGTKPGQVGLDTVANTLYGPPTPFAGGETRQL